MTWLLLSTTPPKDINGVRKKEGDCYRIKVLRYIKTKTLYGLCLGSNSNKTTTKNTPLRQLGKFHSGFNDIKELL